MLFSNYNSSIVRSLWGLQVVVIYIINWKTLHEMNQCPASWQNVIKNLIKTLYKSFFDYSSLASHLAQPLSTFAPSPVSSLVILLAYIFS